MKTEAKAVIYKRLQKFYDNKLTKILEEIAELKAINPKSCNWGECAIDWTKNSTWGNCPRGSYRNGHAYSEYRSVTGCGYDKLSTLTADVDEYELTQPPKIELLDIDVKPIPVK